MAQMNMMLSHHTKCTDMERLIEHCQCHILSTPLTMLCQSWISTDGLPSLSTDYLFCQIQRRGAQIRLMLQFCPNSDI